MIDHHSANLAASPDIYVALMQSVLISLHLSSPVLCPLKLSLSIVLCFSTDPLGYFSQLLKMFIMTFCMNVAFMCGVHVCRCTCTCVCMPEVGLA